ncbi:MAG: hypothetical protein VKP72_02165 [bacterium]|nr:hypothetical protein [bacterium]
MKDGRDYFDRDLGAKNFLTEHGDAFARAFSGHPQARAVEVLTRELRLDRRTPDAVMRVHDPVIGEWLAVIEVQSRVDPRIGKRLAETALHLHLVHDLPVLPVVIHLSRAGGKRPAPVASSLLGKEMRFDFLVIDVWEMEAGHILAEGLDGPWWPFIAFSNGGACREMVEPLIREAMQHPVWKHHVNGCLKMSRYMLDLSWAEGFTGGGGTMRWLADLEPVEGSSEWQARQALASKVLSEGIGAELVMLLKRLIGRYVGIPGEHLQGRLTTLSREQAEDLIEMVPSMNSLDEVERWIDEHTV